MKTFYLLLTVFLLVSRLAGQNADTDFSITPDCPVVSDSPKVLMQTGKPLVYLPGVPELSCVSAGTLRCDGVEFLNQTTNGKGNDFRGTDYQFPDVNATYDAPDVLFVVEVAKKGSVHFVLDLLDNGVDLDLFLMNACQPKTSLRKWSTVNNGSAGTRREILDASLEPGTYYLIVDGALATTAYQGRFNLRMSCACTCIEPNNDLPRGTVIFCDDFERYQNGPLSSQSTRWVAGVEAQVQSETATNRIGRFAAGSTNPGLYFVLDNINSKRYRLSWRMKITTGKGAYFDLKHALPTNSAPSNIAYAVSFNSNGTASARQGGATTGTTFSYAQNRWFNVVNIVDIDANRVELWIDGAFIVSWAFNVGSTGTSNVMSALLFNARANDDFSLDNLCVWESIPNCTAAGSTPVTIASTPATKYTEGTARCALFTAAEWSYGKGTNVCDYSGESIYRAFRYGGVLGNADVAPSLLRNEACVRSAYGGNVPTNLYARIYPFIRNDNQVIGVSFDDKGNSKTKLFVFVCRDNASGCANRTSCIYTYDDNNNDAVPLRACDEFYYFVVTGERGAEYSGLQVIPNGPCPGRNVETTSGDLQCGQVYNGTLVNDGQYPTAEGVPYNNDGCLKTNRPYTGGDNIFNFKLVYDAVATIRVVCKAAIGLRLFDGECLVRCMAAAENQPPLTDTASIVIPLTAGVRYFLLVDKAVPGNPEDFKIFLDCNNRFSVAGDEAACPVSSTGGHTLELGTGAYNFDTGTDKLVFLYPDNGVAKSNDRALVWTPSNGNFIVPPDAPGGLKCSYVDNDTFQVQLNSGNGRSLKRLSMVFSTDPALRSTFGTNGKGKIAQLTDLGDPIKFYLTSPGLQSIRPEGIANIPINFYSNQGTWRATLPTADKTWITYQDIVYTNNQTLELTILPNNGVRPRQARMEFASENRPQELRRSLTIRQVGRCTAPTLAITADKTTICNGETVRLTAQPGRIGTEETADLQLYNWSSGTAKTQAISVTPTVNTTYRVTITNKDCGITATASINIVVVSGGRPAAPSLRSEGTMCLGGNVPMLRVNPPTGATISWYDSNGNLLAQNNNGDFTPAAALVQKAGTYTFFAAAVQGSCSSENRTAVRLQVLEGPTLPGASPVMSCVGKEVALTANFTGGVAPYRNYAWAGQTGTGMTLSLVPPPGTTTYTVSVTDANGCTGTGQLSVIVHPLPTITPAIRPATNNLADGSISLLIEGGQAPYRYRWSRNGVDIPNKTTARLDSLPAGTYGVTATDANGCTISNNSLVVNQVVGTSEPAWSAQVRVFPNPTEGQFTLALEGALQQQPVSVSVTDVLGRLLDVRPRSIASSILFDLSSQPSGVYFIQVYANGQAIVRTISLHR
jgi:Secretion system C-terminal sorting domain/Ig-like domain CHU_C associated